LFAVFCYKLPRFLYPSKTWLLEGLSLPSPYSAVVDASRSSNLAAFWKCKQQCGLCRISPGMVLGPHSAAADVRRERPGSWLEQS